MKTKKKRTIAFQVYSFFFIIVVVPITILGFVLLNWYTLSLINDTKKTLEATSTIIYESVMSDISNALKMATTLGYDDHFLKLVKDYQKPEESHRKVQLEKQLIGYLQNYVFNSNIFHSIRIEMEGTEGYSFSPYGERKAMGFSLEHDIDHEIPIAGRAMLSDQVTINKFSNYDEILFTAIYISGTASVQKSAIVYLSIKPQFTEVLDAISNEHVNMRIWLENSQKKVIFSTHPESMIEKGSSFFLYERSLSPTDWKLIILSTQEAMSHPNSLRLVYFISLFLFFFLIFFLYLVSVVRNVVVPVRELEKKMNGVSEGSYSLLNNNTHSLRETKKLTESYNNMVIKIQELFTEIKKIEEEKMEKEFEALQYQIQPHFLANNLNLIRYLAGERKTEDVQKIAISLTKLIINSFRDFNKMIPLSEELENIQHYKNIMNIRYKNKYQLNFDIPKETDSLLIPKMLLQPLIENSILHGYAETEGKCQINISAFLQSRSLVIEVRDFGTGISEEINEIVTNQSNASNKSFNRIGIKNIDKRLKLHYGRQYGVSIDKTVQKGCLVFVTLPILNNDNE